MNNNSGSENKPSPSLCGECGYDSVEIAHLQKLLDERGKEYCQSCVGNANEMARLQKLCEEQKLEIAELKHRSEVCQKFHVKSFSMDRHIELMEAHEKSLSQLAEKDREIERLKAVTYLCCDKTQSQLATQTAEIDELKKKWLAVGKQVSDMVSGVNNATHEGYSAKTAKECEQVVFSVAGPATDAMRDFLEYDEKRDEQWSVELATQTERVRTLTDALKRARRWLNGECPEDDTVEVVDKALNQESLGDGGKEG